MKRVSTIPFGCMVILLLVFAFATSEGAQTCLQPPPGLVHWWTGDGDATDLVGGSPGTLQGVASFVPGLVDQAFAFDGTGGSVATPAIFPPVGTIELWVNPTSLADPASTQILAGTHGIANGNDRLWIVSGGPGGGPGVAPNTLVVNLGSCCVNDLVIPNPLSPGTWTHLALTFNYTLDVYRLYVNGALQASATAPRNAPSQAFRIGGATSDFGQNFFFNGAVDEVSVYDRVLGASEIQAIAAAGGAGKCTPVGGSVIGVSPTVVECRNLTTRQTIKIQLNGARAWNCTEAGLVVQSGDKIRQTVTGPAD